MVPGHRASLLLILYACFAPGVNAPERPGLGRGPGVTGGIGVLLLYHALAGGIVSTAAPFISMIALTVPVVVGLSLGERPGALPLAGIALGVVAVALISAHGEARSDVRNAGARAGRAPRSPPRSRAAS